MYEAECSNCAGTGRVMAEERLKVKIPTGVEANQGDRLRGKGGEGRNGGPPGDLLLTIAVRPHPFLRRDGLDLEMDVPITFAEALEGGPIEVPTAAGSTVRVNIPKGARNGQKLRLKGKGVKDEGDLYLVLRPTPRSRTARRRRKRSRSSSSRSTKKTCAPTCGCDRERGAGA